MYFHENCHFLSRLRSQNDRLQLFGEMTLSFNKFKPRNKKTLKKYKINNLIFIKHWDPGKHYAFAIRCFQTD